MTEFVLMISTQTVILFKNYFQPLVVDNSRQFICFPNEKTNG